MGRVVAFRSFGSSLAEALAIGVCSCLLALVFNVLRPFGLPLVAARAYQILVPCPEPGGEVIALSAEDPDIGSSRSFIIDARLPAEYRAAHLERAVNLPFDWLDPTPDEDLERLAREIASSRALRVIVYGDGGRPDSGRYLGTEISGRGIKNVFYVEGGAPALLGGRAP